jgi:nitroimidazol reductase NimA-like FMN-containing flavoprotein (pyridoxamine 5'-phosphate oxidase superfamily)
MERSILQLKNKIKELLDQQILGVLATQGEKYPYNTLVAYAFSEDLRYIFFATRKHTRKYNNIMKHHYVSILIDSRTNDVTDFKDAVALTVMGKMVNTTPLEYRELYLNRFPHLKDFIEDPNNTIMTLKMDKYIYVQRFQEVLELEIK